MAEACASSMEAVEINARLLERSLQGTGPRRLGHSRSHSSPETPRNHPPSIPVAQVKPFIEKSKKRISAQGISSLKKQGKSFKLSPILTPTTSPVPSPSGTCHAPAMVGLHGMALKGAMAPPREVSELLCYQDFPHSEEPQRHKVKRKHPKNGLISRNLPPINSSRGSSLVQGAAQQRLMRLAANKSWHAWKSLQSKAESAEMPPSAYRGPVKLISADELENYKIRQMASTYAVTLGSLREDTCTVALGSLREDARGGHAEANCMEHHEQDSGAQSCESISSSETVGGDLPLLEAQQQQQQQTAISKSDFLRKGNFSPTPLKLPLVEQKKTGRQKKETAMHEKPWSGDFTTGWGQALDHSEEMDSMEADLELLQVCASGTFRQAAGEG